MPNVGNCMYIVNTQIPPSHEHRSCPKKTKIIACTPPLQNVLTWVQNSSPSTMAVWTKCNKVCTKNSLSTNNPQSMAPVLSSLLRGFQKPSKIHSFWPFPGNGPKSQPRKDSPIRMLEFPSGLSCCIGIQ